MMQPSLAHPSHPASPQPSRRWRWLLIGLVALVLAAACMAAIVVGGVRAFQGVQREADGALAVVQAFVQAGARNDAAAGAALFSSSGTETPVTQDDVARLFADERDAFQGVTDVRQDGFNLVRATNGTTATLQGTLTYTEQPARRFTARLRQRDSTWRLVNIQFASGLGS